MSKAEVPPVPPLPDGISEFVTRATTDPATEPALAEEFEGQLKDDPDRYFEVADSFQRYLERQWRPWANLPGQPVGEGGGSFDVVEGSYGCHRRSRRHGHVF